MACGKGCDSGNVDWGGGWSMTTAPADAEVFGAAGARPPMRARRQPPNPWIWIAVALATLAILVVLRKR